MTSPRRALLFHLPCLLSTTRLHPQTRRLSSSITNIIRRLLDEVADPERTHFVKQAIITSHNTRFLKEAAFSFLSDNKDDSPARFFRIAKEESGSIVFGPDLSSHITNEYNDLWAEVRRCKAKVAFAQNNGDAPPRFPLLGNTMRRIIESYFLDIGEKGTNYIIEQVQK